MTTPHYHNLLPHWAQDALREAAKVNVPVIPQGESPLRTRFLERTIEKVKRQNPKAFLNQVI